MIYNLTLNDRTQKKVLRELETTEKLISKVATKLSSTQKTCDIYAMSDLGIAHNVTRMQGGFFTGAAYVWEQPDTPFIPVDTTINVCGTALYKIKSDMSITEFKKRCEKALADKSRYDWNFTNGNHFISLCYSENNMGMQEGYYMLVHASACEYKEELYPVIGNWYYQDICTERLNHYRYIRYIKGDKAEKLYELAKLLESYNRERNHNFCKKVLSGNMGREILSVSHYGMPTIHEVLIGVQKTEGLVTLLTSPGKNVYIVKKIENAKNNYMPHGFGLELPEESDFTYHKNGIQIGEKKFYSGSITIGEDAINRHSFSETDESLRKYIRKIVQINELEICAELKQICSFSANGFQVWRGN